MRARALPHMSLPSLDQLPLPCPIGMNAAARREEQRKNAYPYRPHIVCLQDDDPRPQAAARDVYRWAYNYRNLNTASAPQFDDPADFERWKEARDAGLDPPPPPRQFVLPIPANVPQGSGAQARLNIVKQRLRDVAEHVRNVLNASLSIGMYDNDTTMGLDKDGHDGLGYNLTLTERYGGEGVPHRFHQTIDPERMRRFLPSTTRDNWFVMTLVYYCTSQIREATADAVGQNSTLVNMDHDAGENPKEDTQVAFCPMRNGLITILDGSRWHAVGPNYGVPRAAVVLRCVLYKPDAKLLPGKFPHDDKRVVIPEKWSHQEWWDRIENILRNFESKRGYNDPKTSEELYPRLHFSTVPHKEAKLRDVMKQGGAKGDPSEQEFWEWLQAVAPVDEAL